MRGEKGEEIVIRTIMALHIFEFDLNSEEWHMLLFAFL